MLMALLLPDFLTVQDKPTHQNLFPICWNKSRKLGWERSGTSSNPTSPILRRCVPRTYLEITGSYSRAYHLSWISRRLKRQLNFTPRCTEVKSLVWCERESISQLGGGKLGSSDSPLSDQETKTAALLRLSQLPGNPTEASLSFLKGCK